MLLRVIDAQPAAGCALVLLEQLFTMLWTQLLLWQEHSHVADAEVGRFVFNDLAVANESNVSNISDVRQLGKSWLSRNK